MPIQMNHITLHPGLNGEPFAIFLCEEITDASGEVIGNQRLPLEDMTLEISDSARALLDAIIIARGHALTVDEIQARELAKRPAVDPLPEGVG